MQTFLVGERTTFQDPVDGPFYGTWTGSLPEVEESFGRIVGHAGDVPNAAADREDFGSSHTGGAQFILADGHVVFNSENISIEIFQALGTRGDG